MLQAMVFEKWVDFGDRKNIMELSVCLKPINQRVRPGNGEHYEFAKIKRHSV